MPGGKVKAATKFRIDVTLTPQPAGSCHTIPFTRHARTTLGFSVRVQVRLLVLVSANATSLARYRAAAFHQHGAPPDSVQTTDTFAFADDAETGLQVKVDAGCVFLKYGRLQRPDAGGFRTCYKRIHEGEANAAAAGV